MGLHCPRQSQYITSLFSWTYNSYSKNSWQARRAFAQLHAVCTSYVLYWIGRLFSQSLTPVSYPIWTIVMQSIWGYPWKISRSLNWYILYCDLMGNCGCPKNGTCNISSVQMLTCFQIQSANYNHYSPTWHGAQNHLCPIRSVHPPPPPAPTSSGMNPNS